MSGLTPGFTESQKKKNPSNVPRHPGRGKDHPDSKCSKSRVTMTMVMVAHLICGLPFQPGSFSNFMAKWFPCSDTDSDGDSNGLDYYDSVDVSATPSIGYHGKKWTGARGCWCDVLFRLTGNRKHFSFFSPLQLRVDRTNGLVRGNAHGTSSGLDRSGMRQECIRRVRIARRARRTALCIRRVSNVGGTGLEFDLSLEDWGQ